MIGTFLPYFWIGDYDRGLCWMCDSDRGWSVADDEDWPKEMYGQLGFDALGRRYEFTRA